jgi:hypothetical protein
VKFSITTDAARLGRRIQQIERDQMPFALALTLTRTAQHAQAAEIHEMRDVFDRPTPYTLGSTRVRPARKNRLKASVEFKDFSVKATPPSSFLMPQVRGGARDLKRYERALFHAGILPPGMYAVPGAAARIDAWGNMERGQIIQILSYFQAFHEMGFRANTTAQGRARLARGSRRRYGQAYFVIRPGDPTHLKPGIWLREIHGFGTRVRPILRFVTRAQYEAERFDFYYVAEKAVEKHAQSEFRRAYAEAMQTARTALP